MSPGPADQVNAKELSARAAVLERRLELAQLQRVKEAGALEGTRINAHLEFGTFQGQATVAVTIAGNVVLPCQRCLAPCECAVDEQAQLVVVRDENDDVPGGYEPFVGSPEQLSLAAVIEEQVLLALPLVPMHEPGTPGCLPSGADAVPPASRSATTNVAAAQAAPPPSMEEKQTPFANLRELLERKHGRDPQRGE
jgi:uncharacterized protein